MTPAAKEGLPAVVGELVAKWRADVGDSDQRTPVMAVVHECADELEATLSALTAEAGKGEVTDADVDRAVYAFNTHRRNHPEQWNEAMRVALTAALSTATPAGEWREIESAPKDGTRILMAYPCGAVKFGFYLDNSDTTRPWAGWRVTSGELTPFGKPTHWQPLPAPPLAASPRGASAGESV